MKFTEATGSRNFFQTQVFRIVHIYVFYNIQKFIHVFLLFPCKGRFADIKLLDTYDTYYISRKRNLELPVWKVSIRDVDNSCYYINPRNGQYRYVNTPSRWNHWMYPALHSLNLKFLVDHPVLWNPYWQLQGLLPSLSL